MKGKLFLTLALLALLSAWMARPAAAQGFYQCNEPPRGPNLVAGFIVGQICKGWSTDTPAVPYTREVKRAEKDTSTVWRYYYWRGQNGALRGKMLSSHHDAVEAGLNSRQIQQGLVSLDDSKGVNCTGVVNTEGCLWYVGDGS